jgi:hypothetical protein
MGLLDPLANWSTFTIFDPRMLHFPLSWPWVRIAPLVEPVLAFLGGYPMYYFTVALGIFWLYKHLVAQRVRPQSWVARHPLWTVFAIAFVLGLPIDAVAQSLWIRAGLYVYTQAAGPNLHWANVTLPTVWLLYDPWIFAVIAVLIYRDDRGQSLALSRLSQRLPFSQGPSQASPTRQILTGVFVMLSISLVPIGFYSILRVGHYTHPSYNKFPYPQVKVYDPYADLQHAGKPGPFYR